MTQGQTPSWAGRLLSAIFKSNGGPQQQPQPYGALNVIGATLTPNPATGDLDMSVPAGAGQIPNSVTALRSLPATNARISIAVDGYSTPGDGGGGTFIWNATDTRADDGGTIIAVTGVATGRWNRIQTGPLDIRWFGADQTGVADSTSAINAALQAPGLSLYVNRRVYAPTGVYKYSSSIVMQSHTEFFGDPWKYLGPGNGGQFGTVLRWDGGTGAANSFEISCAATGDHILQFHVHDLLFHGNFGTTTANSVTGWLIAGSGGGGGKEVHGGKVHNVMVAEFNVGCQWGNDGGAGDSQADSIDWYQAFFYYNHDAGMEINSANAADASVMRACEFSGFLTDLPNAVGLRAKAYGLMRLEDTQGDNLESFVDFQPGNTFHMTNCETENCNYFLNATAGATDDYSLILIGNTINNAIRFNGAIVRTIAIGNVIQAFNGGANAATPGISLATAGNRWKGYGNTYQSTFPGVTKVSGATYEENDVQHAGGLNDQKIYAAGHTMWQPQSAYGATDLDPNALAEVCERSGIRGIPWAANTATPLNTYTVAVPDNGHVFKATTVVSDTKTGGTQPTWNTGAGATTTDGNVTWTESGASSLHELVGPPGMMRADAIPASFCRQGTIVWKRTITDGSSAGWMAIADTQGAVASDWVPLETGGLSIAQNSIALADADTVLTRAQYESPRLGFGGTLTASRLITFPSQAGFRAARWIVNNGSTWPLRLTAGSGEIVLGVGGQAEVIVVGSILSFGSKVLNTSDASSVGLTVGTVNVGTSVSGTYALLASDYCYQQMNLTGSLSGDLAVVFPSLSYPARWLVKTAGLTLNGHTLTFQAGTTVWGVTTDTNHAYDVTYDPIANRLVGVALTY